MIDVAELIAKYEKKCREQPIDVHFTPDYFDRHVKEMEIRHNKMLAKSLEKYDHQPIPKT